jgi:hypothetical protein
MEQFINIYTKFQKETETEANAFNQSLEDTKSRYCSLYSKAKERTHKSLETAIDQIENSIGEINDSFKEQLNGKNDLFEIKCVEQGINLKEPLCNEINSRISSIERIIFSFPESKNIKDLTSALLELQRVYSELKAIDSDFDSLFDASYSSIFNVDEQNDINSITNVHEQKLREIGDNLKTSVITFQEGTLNDLLTATKVEKEPLRHCLIATKNVGKDPNAVSLFLELKLETPEIREGIYQEFSTVSGHLLFLEDDPDDESTAVIMRKIVQQYLHKAPLKTLHILPLGFFPADFKGLIWQAQHALKDPSIVSSVVDDPTEINSKIAELKGVVDDRDGKYFGLDFFKYNKANPDNPDPMIVLFLYDYPNCSSPASMHNLEIILKDGPRDGVYVVATYITSIQNAFPGSYLRLDDPKFHFQVFDATKGSAIRSNGIEISSDIEAPGFNPIHFIESLKGDDTLKVPAIDIEKIVSDNTTFDFSSVIDIPVGKSGNNVQDVTFEVRNEKSSMIIAGIQGSGKSEFLHTLIMSAAWKYSPKELNFMLIDFKDGAEFRPYTNQFAIPHVKLVSGNNKLEDAWLILDKIRKEKEKRNSLFVAAGVKDIVEYNQKFPEKQIPRLFVVIDEYQVMLEGSGSMPAKCEEILTALIKEIRSAGISVILSSQACSCGSQILSQINNRVVLKSNGALEKMIPSLTKGEEQLAASPRGSAYFSNGSNISLFRGAYIGDSAGKADFANKIRDKYANEKAEVVLSNDEKAYPFGTSHVEKDEIDTLRVDYGLSALDNEHLTLDFKAKQPFGNPLLVGPFGKAFDIENAIARNGLLKEDGANINLGFFGNQDYGFAIPNDLKPAKSMSEIAKQVNDLYDVYQIRVKNRSQGLAEPDDKIHILFLNSCDASMLDGYDKESAAALQNPDSPWDNKPTVSLRSKIEDLYRDSFKYRIFIFLHFDSPADLNDFFEYPAKPQLSCAFYLNQTAYQYYADKTFGLSTKLILEERNSLSCFEEGALVKFKRYQSEEETK